MLEDSVADPGSGIQCFFTFRIPDLGSKIFLTTAKIKTLPLKPYEARKKQVCIPLFMKDPGSRMKKCLYPDPG
jgi:hypothetical protein